MSDYCLLICMVSLHGFSRDDWSDSVRFFTIAPPDRLSSTTFTIAAMHPMMAMHHRAAAGAIVVSLREALRDSLQNARHQRCFLFPGRSKVLEAYVQSI